MSAVAGGSATVVTPRQAVGSSPGALVHCSSRLVCQAAADRICHLPVQPSAPASGPGLRSYPPRNSNAQASPRAASTGRACRCFTTSLFQLPVSRRSFLRACLSSVRVSAGWPVAGFFPFEASHVCFLCQPVSVSSTGFVGGRAAQGWLSQPERREPPQPGTGPKGSRKQDRFGCQGPPTAPSRVVGLESIG
jgi:hypothetical protein